MTVVVVVVAVVAVVAAAAAVVAAAAAAVTAVTVGDAHVVGMLVALTGVVVHGCMLVGFEDVEVGGVDCNSATADLVAVGDEERLACHERHGDCRRMDWARRHNRWALGTLG